MWRWLSATALVAVGLVMGPSVAGAQQTAIAHATSWAELGHGSVIAPAQFHSHPGDFLSGPQPHVGGRSFTSESTNWSGQIATGTTFTAITGDWVVPTVQPTQYGGASATWIGIDGGPSSPSSIIQTGTAQLTEGGQTALLRLVRALSRPCGDHRSGLAR